LEYEDKFLTVYCNVHVNEQQILAVKLEDFCWHFFDETFFGRDLYNSDALDRGSTSPKRRRPITCCILEPDTHIYPNLFHAAFQALLQSGGTPL